MKTGNFKFGFYLLAATFATIIAALVIEEYKLHFAFDDFGTITSIIQGTFGVAVSLAGAFVAIRLAQLSTLIIEKEKKREDSKFYHQIIQETIYPIKQLNNKLQGFSSSIYPYRALFMISNNDLDGVDLDAVERDLVDLKRDIIKGFKELIDGFKGIAESQYSYSFWLHLTDKRIKQKTLITYGGDARFSRNDENMQINGFLIEDLNVLAEISQISIERFSKCELTLNDLQTAARIWEARNTKNFDGIGYTFGGELVITLTLLSCYQNRFLAVTPLRLDDYFENQFVLLMIDIYHNIPKKKDLIDFSKSLFSEDSEEVIANSPVVKTFDMLNDAYWLSFFTTAFIADIDVSTLTSKNKGEMLGGSEAAKIWYEWQNSKVGLYNPYFSFDENFKKTKPKFRSSL